jgi:hypothetical protein
MDARGESVNGCTRLDQRRRGGSIPTSPLLFRLGQTEAARQLVIEYHYSQRVKSGGRVIGTFHRPDKNGLCVAACIFHEPPSIWRERVLDLHRLVRRPYCKVPLSQLVAWTCRAVQKSGIADLLVSYADSTQGHHGGIYQACGWNYHGKRPAKLDGYISRTGKFIPARTATNKLGCNRRKELARRGYRAHFDKGKHLYWRALTPEGEAKAARLGLQKLGYPKPGKRRSTVTR